MPTLNLFPDILYVEKIRNARILVREFCCTLSLKPVDKIAKRITNGNPLDKTIVMNSRRDIQMEYGLFFVAMLVGLFLLTRKGEKPQEVKITSPGKRTQ